MKDLRPIFIAVALTIIITVLLFLFISINSYEETRPDPPIMKEESVIVWGLLKE